MRNWSSVAVILLHRLTLYHCTSQQAFCKRYANYLNIMPDPPNPMKNKKLFRLLATLILRRQGQT